MGEETPAATSRLQPTHLHAPPRVSVVMAAYNAADHVAETIDSILAQTFSDFELIIVDDGSTDATRAIVDGYADPRIVRIYNEANLGVAKTRNIGGAAVRGEYLAVHDADDLSAPERFEKQVAFLDAVPTVGLVGTQGYHFNSTGTQPIDVPLRNDEIQQLLLGLNCLHHSSIMMRTAVYDEVGGYDERYVAALDIDLVLRIAEQAEVANLPERLYFKRNITCSITNSKRGLAQSRLGVIAVEEAIARRRANGAVWFPHRDFSLKCLNAACAELALGEDGSASKYLTRAYSVDQRVTERHYAAEVLASSAVRYARIGASYTKQPEMLVQQLLKQWPEPSQAKVLERRTLSLIGAGQASVAYQEGHWWQAITAAGRSLYWWPTRPGTVGSLKLMVRSVVKCFSVRGTYSTRHRLY